MQFAQEVQMNQLIYTYAMIKSLYDEEQDYLDTFVPFVLKVFKENEYINKKNVQSRLEKEYNLNVMQHVIAAILNRAKKKKYIQREGGTYVLTKEGLSYIDNMKGDKEIRREINSLVEDIKTYFKEHDNPMDNDEIYNFLLAFIDNNLGLLVECINPTVDFKKISFPRLKENGRIFIDYIKLAEEKKPRYFNILQQMVMGSIISAILYAKDPSELQTIKSGPLKNLKVYLDANFVLFVLGLYTPEFNEPAQELFGLLKDHNLDIKIFDFTVDEISRVILNYETQAHRYPTTIKINTLYSHLKRKGWKKTDAREFILNLEETLQKQGIDIESTNIDIDNYEPSEDKLRDYIELYKPGQLRPYQNHDLAAIEKIKQLRGKPARKMEYAKVFFLTSDHRLNEFNLRQMGHKDYLTIGEVILDRLLTNIIWLKNPKLKIPLKSIISLYSRELFVNRRVWDRFYNILTKVKDDGEVTDNQISNLFYHGYIEHVLIDYDENDIADITETFVLEEIENAAKYQEEMSKKKIKEVERKKDEKQKLEIEKKRKEFNDILIQKTNEAKEEKEKEWLGKIQKIKNKKKAEAAKEAERRIIIMKILVAIIILILPIYFIINNDFQRFGIIVGVATVAALILVLLVGPMGAKWKNLEEKFANKIFVEKLQEAGLDKLK